LRAAAARFGGATGAGSADDGSAASVRVVSRRNFIAALRLSNKKPAEAGSSVRVAVSAIDDALLLLQIVQDLAVRAWPVLEQPRFP
jgi:hypothetical protein